MRLYPVLGAILSMTCGGRVERDADLSSATPVGETGQGEAMASQAANVISFVSGDESFEFSVNGSQTGGHAVVETETEDFAFSLLPYDATVFQCSDSSAAPLFRFRMGDAVYGAGFQVAESSCEIDVSEAGLPTMAYHLQASFTATLVLEGFLRPEDTIWGAASAAPDNTPNSGGAPLAQVELSDGVIDVFIP